MPNTITRLKIFYLLHDTIAVAISRDIASWRTRKSTDSPLHECSQRRAQRCGLLSVHTGEMSSHASVSVNGLTPTMMWSI